MTLSSGLNRMRELTCVRLLWLLTEELPVGMSSVITEEPSCNHLDCVRFLQLRSISLALNIAFPLSLHTTSTFPARGVTTTHLTMDMDDSVSAHARAPECKLQSEEVEPSSCQSSARLYHLTQVTDSACLVPDTLQKTRYAQSPNAPLGIWCRSILC